MGHYTGVHIRFTVKPTISEELLKYFKRLFTVSIFQDTQREPFPVPLDGRNVLNIDDQLRDTLHVSDELGLHVWAKSSSFENWNTRGVTENKDGTHTFESFSSLKYEDRAMFVVLFETIKNDLVIQHGDILVRTIYENSYREHVVFYHGGMDQFLITDGHDYSEGVDSTSGCPDSDDLPNHPYNAEDNDPRFVPAMNIFTLFPNYRNLEVVTNREKFDDGNCLGYHSTFRTPYSSSVRKFS